MNRVGIAQAREAKRLAKHVSHIRSLHGRGIIVEGNGSRGTQHSQVVACIKDIDILIYE